MKRSQFDAILGCMERDAGGKHYEVEVFLRRDLALTGALFAPVTPGVSGVIGLTLTYNGHNARNVYIDLEEILAMRGPIP